MAGIAPRGFHDHGWAMGALFDDLDASTRRTAVGAFLVLAGILAAHTLLETARDALFLASVPVERLPWAYLAIVAIALAVTRLPALRTTRGLPLLLLLSAGVTLGFWPLVRGDATPSLYALYVWVGLYATLTVLQFWVVVGNLATITDAKRIYGFIGSGAITGAIAGAAAANGVTWLGSSAALLPAAALVLVATALGAIPLTRRAQHSRRRDRSSRHDAAAADADGASTRTPWRDLGIVHRSPYLRRVGLIVFLSATTLTLVDFLFKSRVAGTWSEEALGSFFAAFYAGTNVVALAVQVVVTPLLMRHLGVHRALCVLPLLLCGGTVGLALGGGLPVVLALKGAEGSLRHSLHRTTTEILYVPLSEGLRARAKPVVEVLGQRGGQAIGSVALLAFVASGWGTAAVPTALGGLAVAWLAVAVGIRRPYLDVFRDTIRRGRLFSASGRLPLDLDSLEQLLTSLNSADDEEVLAALEVFAAERRMHLVPVVLLYHPSRRVVLRLVELFHEAGRTDFAPVAERLLEQSDPEIRATALWARHLAEPAPELMRRMLADDSSTVRAMAAALLGHDGTPEDGAKARAILEELAEGSAACRRAVARSVFRARTTGYEDLLYALCRDPDPEVQADGAEALGAVGDTTAIDRLIEMLATRRLRYAARRSLVRLGEPALERLREALRDPDQPTHVRRHLPRSISRFSSDRAATILQEHLDERRDGLVRYKILRALGRVLADRPDAPLDVDALQRAQRRDLEAAYRCLEWRLALERGIARHPHRRTASCDLLDELLRDKQHHAVERVFRLLDMEHPDESFERIHAGLGSDDRATRASSLELLENLLASPVREAVLGLVDERPDRARPPAGEAFHRPQELGYEEVLAAAMDTRSRSLSGLAAHHAAELGMHGLRPRLEQLVASDEPALADAVRHALTQLDATPPTEAANG